MGPLRARAWQVFPLSPSPDAEPNIRFVRATQQDQEHIPDADTSPEANVELAAAAVRAARMRRPHARACLRACIRGARAMYLCLGVGDGVSVCVGARVCWGWGWG